MTANKLVYLQYCPVGIDALFDKGRRKEGSWEALKLGRWEKEEGLEAGNMTIE
jgi:hypothetical protein